VKIRNSPLKSTKISNSKVPKYAIYLREVILDFDFEIFLVDIVYIAHSMGVRRANK
jgi:hypothetical protein